MSSATCSFRLALASSPRPSPAQLFQSLPRCRRAAGPRPIERQLQHAAAALFDDGQGIEPTKSKTRCRRYAVLLLGRHGSTRVVKDPCCLRDAMAYIRLFRSMGRARRGRKVVLAKLVERGRGRGRRVVA